jgi:hypothetical protein
MKLYAARLEVAQWYVDMAKNESYVVVSFDESNIHEASGVTPGQCFEVLEDEAEGVPLEIRFVELAKETRTQKTKVIYGMACCPYGPIYFKHFESRGRKNRKEKNCLPTDQYFFFEKNIFT